MDGVTAVQAQHSEEEALVDSSVASPTSSSRSSLAEKKRSILCRITDRRECRLYEFGIDGVSNSGTSVTVALTSSLHSEVRRCVASMESGGGGCRDERVSEAESVEP